MNTLVETQKTSIVPIIQDNRTAKPEFGMGRYSPLMQETFDTAQTVFGLNAQEAEKLAREIASSLGAIMAKAPVEVKLGKLNKEAKLTISEASKLKGFTVTDPIMALKALHFAGEAGKNGFSFAKTKWQVKPELEAYLSTL